MNYKTICHQMLQDRPTLYDQLLRNRNLLPMLEQYATQLRNNHLEWKELLTQARPGSNEQISIEALEIALQELEDSLPPASPQDEEDSLSLDAAMAFICHRKPPA